MPADKAGDSESVTRLTGARRPPLTGAFWSKAMPAFACCQPHVNFMLATWAAFSPLLLGLRHRKDGQGGVACLENDPVRLVGPVHGTLGMDASSRIRRLTAYGAGRANRSEHFWLRVIH